MPTDPAQGMTPANLAAPQVQEIQPSRTWILLSLGLGALTLLGIGVTVASMRRQSREPRLLSGGRRLEESDIDTIGESLEQHAVFINFHNGDQLRLNYETVAKMDRLARLAAELDKRG